MLCPLCKSLTTITTSNVQKRGSVVRRDRLCLSVECSYAFSTREILTGQSTKRYRKQRDAKFKTLWLEGYRREDIAEILNIDLRTVARTRVRLSLPARKVGRPVKNEG